MTDRPALFVAYFCIILLISGVCLKINSKLDHTKPCPKSIIISPHQPMTNPLLP